MSIYLIRVFAIVNILIHMLSRKGFWVEMHAMLYAVGFIPRLDW